MDTTHSHNLTLRERTELQSKIQRLEWLLKECIGLEEYELCSQIRNLIHKKYELLALNTTHNEVE
jgi:protein-arginine kinase activator protein McsA